MKKKKAVAAFFSFQKICHISQSEYHDLRDAVFSLSLLSAIFLQIIRDEQMATMNKENFIIADTYLPMFFSAQTGRHENYRIYLEKNCCQTRKCFYFCFICAVPTRHGVVSCKCNIPFAVSCCSYPIAVVVGR